MGYLANVDTHRPYWWLTDSQREILLSPTFLLAMEKHFTFTVTVVNKETGKTILDRIEYRCFSESSEQALKQLHGLIKNEVDPEK